jgi:hypothetical protein
MTADEWIKLHIVENVFEMEALKGALDKEEIEHFVREYRDTAYDGLFVLQKGYAAFYVKSQDLAAAQTIVNALGRFPHVILPED